jgi:hypothetical protein
MCDQCAKFFIELSALTTHMRVPLLEKPCLTCDHCAKQFAVSIFLKSHLMIDTIESHNLVVSLNCSCEISFCLCTVPVQVLRGTTKELTMEERKHLYFFIMVVFKYI